MADHIQMAVGDGIERTGIERDAGHGPVYPDPANAARHSGSARKCSKPDFYFKPSFEPGRGSLRLLAEVSVSSQPGHETNRRRHEQTSAAGEIILVRVTRINGLTNGGPTWPNGQGNVMIKALSVVAVAAFIAGALTILPGFTPQVEASQPQTLAETDRLDVQPARLDCSQQAWPNIDASCLRTVNGKATVKAVRLITADRAPN